MDPFGHVHISRVMVLQPGLDVQQSQEGHECQSHGLVGERGLSRLGWERGGGWGHPGYPQSLSGQWHHRKP